MAGTDKVHFDEGQNQLDGLSMGQNLDIYTALQRTTGGRSLAEESKMGLQMA